MPINTWPHSHESSRLPATLPGGKPWPRISIVTPSLNQGAYIEETILSVLNQDYPDLEHIVMDGGSTDGTGDVLDGYGDRLAKVVSEPDNGQCNAINKGFSHATGELFTWLNADDMLAPGALAAVAMGFHTSGADLVAGICRLLREGRIITDHLTSCPEGKLPLDELLQIDEYWLKGRFFYQPEVVFSRSIWERAGGFLDEKLYWNLDYDLWVRCAKAGARLHVIGRPVAIFRVHDEQKTSGDAVYVPELREVSRRHREEAKAPQEVDLVPEKKFKAVFVNDSGPLYGAGIAHTRVGNAMEIAGHDISFVQMSDDGQAFDVKDVFWEVVNQRPDVVFLGNIHGAGQGPEFVELLARFWPLCQVLHDLWAVTGRCVYNGNCTMYLDRCDENCPTPYEYPPLPSEHIYSAWRAKRELMESENSPLLLANSDWSKQVARQSAIARGGAVQNIKLACPLDVFRPQDRDACRKALGLPKDRFLVLFAACDVQEKRKGLAHLIKALDEIDLPDVTPVCFGRISQPGMLGTETIAAGYVDDHGEIAMLYGAADVFVAPSLHESFGQVFVEAAACGTPSIAYQVGGVPEALTDGITGRIVRKVHPSALAAAIVELHDNPSLRDDLGLWARIQVENEWSMARAYHRLHGVLSEHGAKIGFLPPRNIKLDPEGKTNLQPRFLQPGGGAITCQDPLAAPGDGECVTSFAAGFAALEGPFPDLGIDRIFRWGCGSSGTLRLHAARRGLFHIRIKCVNLLRRQRIRILLDGILLKTVRPRTSAGYSDMITLAIEAEMYSGVHELTMEFSRGVKEKDGRRQLAIMVFGIEVRRQKDPGEAAGTSPKALKDAKHPYRATVPQSMKMQRELEEKGILWLASYPRSGNSWVRFLLGAYACGGADLWSVCNEEVLDLHNLLGASKRKDLEPLDMLWRERNKPDREPAPDFRMKEVGLKTHFKWSSEHPWSGHTGKVIYLLRHPKDVLLSAINYLKLMQTETRTEEEAAWDFIRNRGEPRWKKLFGSWFEHYESWNGDPDHPNLLVRYEDLRKDPLSELLRMLRFLGIRLDEERAGKAVDSTSLRRMRKLEVENRANNNLPRFKEGYFLVREGLTEQTLAHLGPGLDKAFDETFGPELEATGYA